MILRKLIAARIYQILGHFREHLLTLLLFSISIKKDSFIKGHLFKSHLEVRRVFYFQEFLFEKCWIKITQRTLEPINLDKSLIFSQFRIFGTRINVAVFPYNLFSFLLVSTFLSPFLPKKSSKKTVEGILFQYKTSATMSPPEL